VFLGVTRTKRALLNERMSAVHAMIAQWSGLHVLALAISGNTDFGSTDVQLYMKIKHTFVKLTKHDVIKYAFL
jgi:hypothetical protein